MSDLAGVDASLLARDLDARPYRQAFVAVLDRELSRAQVAALVTERLERAPRFRQVVGGWPAPKWVADDGFDVMGHVRETTLPAGLTIESWLAQRLGMSSDRDHPLWQLWLLRLPGDRHALVLLAHPALAAPAHLLDALMDGGQTPRGTDDTDARHKTTPDGPLFSAAQVVLPGAVAQVEALATGLGAMVDSAWRTVGAAPASFRVAGVDVALGDVRRVADATASTVLDVALTLVAQGLARTGEAGEDPVALVPVGGVGRALELPLGVTDPHARLTQIASMTSTWATTSAPSPAGAAHANAARAIVGAAPHRVLVIGVGEVPGAVRVGDARVQGLTVFTTPADDEDVTVDVTTCAGRVFFGATAMHALDGFGGGVLAALNRLMEGR